MLSHSAEYRFSYPWKQIVIHQKLSPLHIDIYQLNLFIETSGSISISAQFEHGGVSLLNDKRGMKILCYLKNESDQSIFVNKEQFRSFHKSAEPFILFKTHLKDCSLTWNIRINIKPCKLWISHFDLKCDQMLKESKESLLKDALSSGDVSFIINPHHVPYNKKREFGAVLNTNPRPLIAPPSKRRRLNADEAKKTQNMLSTAAALDAEDPVKDEREVKCFSNLLVCHSDVLKAMIQNTHFAEGKEKRIFFQGTYTDCKHFIEFLVMNELNIKANKFELFKLGHIYQIEALQYACCERMIRGLKVDNFVETARLFDTYNIKWGNQFLIEFASKNMKRLQKHKSWPSFMNSLPNIWRTCLTNRPFPT
eukprot:157651_1